MTQHDDLDHGRFDDTLDEQGLDHHQREVAGDPTSTFANWPGECTLHPGSYVDEFTPCPVCSGPRDDSDAEATMSARFDLVQPSDLPAGPRDSIDPRPTKGHTL